MSVEKGVEELVQHYLKSAEDKAVFMTANDLAKLVRDVGHKAAMLGYALGMKTAKRTQSKDLEIAELSVKELTERVKELETQMIAMNQ